MQGISTKAIGSLENKKKYNGIELENDLELQTYDAFFRELDPQTARWWQVDPVTEGYEHLSPYASMYNNPLTYSDPLGNEGEACCWEEIKAGLSKVFFGATPVDRGVREYAFSAAETTVQQMGENFQKRWEARADPIHQFIDASPGERLSMGGPLGIVKGNVQTEVSTAKSLLNSETKAEAKNISSALTKAESKVLTIEQKAENLVPLNNNKARVTIRSEKFQLETDLTGKPHTHNGVEYKTPHTKISPRNFKAPINQQPVYNTSKKHADYHNATTEEIRIIKNYLRSQMKQ